VKRGGGARSGGRVGVDPFSRAFVSDGLVRRGCVAGAGHHDAPARRTSRRPCARIARSPAGAGETERVQLREDLEGTLATLLQLEKEAPENWRVQRALGQAYRT